MIDCNWHKSSYSNNLGCVDVRYVSPANVIEVRDTKLGDDSPVLRFTPEEWDAFIKGVKDGEFDLPRGASARLETA